MFLGNSDSVMLYKALRDNRDSAAKRQLVKVCLRRAVRAALNTGAVVNGRDH
jgi:hypothetical protein